MQLESIDYINAHGHAREHTRVRDTWRTLCGVEIRAGEGSLGGFGSPAGHARCRSCERMAAFYAGRSLV